MADLTIPLPCRRHELVSRPIEGNGSYLIRNRRAGVSFSVGPEEHFLLAHLDGNNTAENLRAAFADRFGQPLSEEELMEFLDQATECDFLEPEGSATPRPLQAGSFQEYSTLLPLPPARLSGLTKRIASRLLTASAVMLEGIARLLQDASQRIHGFRLRRLDFVPQSEDVFIVSYPRSGTTWMQMILYQLTTDGGMDFPHIAEFCPWFERSRRSARGFDTRPSPRLFKSHLPYRRIPKGPCRYIYVARDGKDVAISCYHLYRRYNGYEGTITEFFERFLRGKVEFGSWFEHVREWSAHRHDPNVLFLTYEELTRDLEACIRRIIAFCGFDVPAERLPVILERCHFSFMKQYESQFDPALEMIWEQGVELNSFLRNGRVGEGAVHLSGPQEARFDEAFRRRLGRTEFAAPAADALHR